MDNITDRSMELRWEQKWPRLLRQSIHEQFWTKSPSSRHTLSLIWWRYIDDLFLLWTHSKEKLNDFITYLNNLHPTIKFTSSFSYNEVPFLDVKVMLLNGRLETDLYVKPTDKHHYLLKSSCHPSHTKQSIPFSMALRLRRICSTDEFFNTRSDALTSHLIKRGYKYRFVKDEIDKVRQIPRSRALKTSTKKDTQSPTEFHL